MRLSVHLELSRPIVCTSGAVQAVPGRNQAVTPFTAARKALTFQRHLQNLFLKTHGGKIKNLCGCKDTSVGDPDIDWKRKTEMIKSIRLKSCIEFRY